MDMDDSLCLSNGDLPWCVALADGNFLNHPRRCSPVLFPRWAWAGPCSMPGSWTHPCLMWMQSMGCFDLAHSQHLQVWLVPAPLAILAQHSPSGGWDTAAEASLDVLPPTWGRVRPGRAPACSRKPPARSATVRATREPKPGGSALAPQWDREVPALGLVSWSLPVFLLRSLKKKLILASGSLSFIPDCCSP